MEKILNHDKSDKSAKADKRKRTKAKLIGGLASTRYSLPISLLRTRELIMESIRPILRRHDITDQQWRVLRVIVEEDGADATTIADRACIFVPSLTRILRTLVDKELVIVIKDPDDGRRNRIHITVKGKNFLQKVAPESIEAFQRMRTIIGNERWENLVTLLAEIRVDMKNTDTTKTQD